MFKQLIFTLSLVLTLTAVFGQKPSKLKGNVQFEVGKSAILPTEETKLTGILAQLRSSPLEYEIAIQGNTDATGSKKYNYNLSKERVEAVKNWFIKQGIVEDVLSDDFFGEENPVANNMSEQGKQLNRRVDIDITFFNDAEIAYTPAQPQVEPVMPIVEKFDINFKSTPSVF